MKVLKRLLCLLPFFIMFILSGCERGANIKIGVMQIVEHESLNNAKKGFADEIKSLSNEIGKEIELDYQVACGDLSNCYFIADKFVNDRKDLILAISTPCAQAAANATRDIPILATAITDFEGAKIIKSNERPGTNVTGVSDLVPIKKIIELILKLKSDVKKVGILYSTIDQSPKYQADIAEKEINSLGLESKRFTVSEIHEVQQVTEQLVEEVDALYVPIDKITFSAMPQISEVFFSHGKFVVCAEDAMISRGVVGTYGMDYYELGKIAAHQAIKILRGESEPKNMPVEYLRDAKLNLNNEIIKRLSLEVSKDLEGN